MGDTPVLRITPAGPVRPTFPDCLGYEQASTRAIYGQDLYLGNDCQDGQFLSFRAEAYHDVNGELLAAYESFSPATAVGAALDRVVKINGLRRKIPTFSTVPVVVVGVVGSKFDGVVVTDPAGNRWTLPTQVVIPYAGQIVVQATCATVGAVRLTAGDLDTAAGKGSIFTPQLGLQSIANVADTSVGAPVEKDSALRTRQAISTMIPSLSVTDGLAGALAAVAGVNRLKVYENDTSIKDENGVPAHAIACVVDGGDPQQIASVIRVKKGPGASTFGSTIIPVQSTSGIWKNIAFFYLSQPVVSYALQVINLGGFTQSISDALARTLADWTSGLGIGEDVEYDQAFAAAKFYDGAGSKTFKLKSLVLSRNGAIPESGDVSIAFNEAATASAANVSIEVVAS